MMSIAVAEMLVGSLTRAATDSSDAPPKAPGLARRWARAASGVLGRVLFARPAPEPYLEAQLARLAALSPHLLVDIGVDPITRKLIEPADDATPVAMPVQQDVPTDVFPTRTKPRAVRVRPADRRVPVGAVPA
jgi:hypothetical protein